MRRVVVIAVQAALIAAVALASTACSSGGERQEPVASAAGAGAPGGAGQTDDGQAAGAGGAGGIGTQGGGQAGAGAGATNAGSGGAGVALTKAEACLEYMRGHCEARVRCELGRNPLMQEHQVQDCFLRWADLCPDLLFAEGSLRTIEGSIACADEWRALACGNFRAGQAPACAAGGMRAAGEPCVFPMQCASGSCSSFGNASGSADLGCGMCEAIARIGESCGGATTHTCEFGARCNDQFVCEALEVRTEPERAPPALGEDCTRGVRECPDAECASVMGDSVCRAWATLGQPCGPTTQSCRPDDSYCGPSGVCVALPTDGQPCANDDHGTDKCAPYHGCTATPETCRRWPGAGEECGAACADGLACICDGDTCDLRRCRNLRLLGESCTGPNDACLWGPLRCENGRCVAVESQGLLEAVCGP